MIFFLFYVTNCPGIMGRLFFLFKRYFFYLCSVGFFVYDVHIIRKKVGENAEVFARINVVFSVFFIV